MLHSRTDRPVDPLTIAALRVVDVVLKRNGTAYFLAGATARDILLWHVLGLPIERATRDIDLAITAESWRGFSTTKEALIDTGEFTPDPTLVHRLYYSTEQHRAGYPLDIIPFGGLEAESGRLEWPPDNNVRMTVLGFRESLERCVLVELAPDLVVPVPPLSSLAALKLLAWRDRQHMSKDALDLALLMRTYASAGNEDRLFGVDVHLMAAADFDLRLAGARLLGADILSGSRPETIDALRAVILDVRLREKLVLHMLGACRSGEDPMGLASDLLDHFAAGLG